MSNRDEVNGMVVMGMGLGRRRGNRRHACGGPADICYCPNCNHVEPHRRGIPCNETPCPICNTKMIRR